MINFGALKSILKVDDQSAPAYLFDVSDKQLPKISVLLFNPEERGLRR